MKLITFNNRYWLTSYYSTYDILYNYNYNIYAYIIYVLYI